MRNKPADRDSKTGRFNGTRHVAGPGRPPKTSYRRFETYTEALAQQSRQRSWPSSW
jgi:hypothetical protein